MGQSFYLQARPVMPGRGLMPGMAWSRFRSCCGRATTFRRPDRRKPRPTEWARLPNSGLAS